MARGAASDSAVWCACKWSLRGGVDVAVVAVLMLKLSRTDCCSPSPKFLKVQMRAKLGRAHEKEFSSGAVMDTLTGAARTTFATEAPCKILLALLVDAAHMFRKMRAAPEGEQDQMELTA
eukprot:COSAG01_NODE_13884_length_1522_cov_2.501757_2_plen_120_part_00